ncbi:hypothetical protein [Lentilitoribacter sp. Alg239-R112]|uniref:hypothetical protein n=1 Tax=Lentilitoribacter sp. Alg239-R112 TaxID=2305987 RepID=UPI0013A69B09|nr:hypothetical protein [Lentilitoribacter sp. Alg239-R112]
MKTQFQGGPNIAMKVPPHQYEATVAFYRDVLQLAELPNQNEESTVFKFGENNLWIDSVNTVSQAEIWLQVITNNSSAAENHLNNAGISRCDTIEPLGDEFDGYWISNPASIIHLIDGVETH